MMNHSRILTALLLLSCLALPVACGRPPATEEPVLKVGVLGILDTLPMYVADQEGYFQAQGISVELLPFKSALERDTAMQAGQVDGVLNDLVSAALLNKDEGRVMVVRVAMRPAPSQAMFRLLAAPQGKVNSPADLRGVEIGVSKSTVIEYVSDSLLMGAGVKPADIVYTPIPDIGLRLNSLVEGKIAAATLPEPMASLAVKQGARPILDDSRSTVGQSVLSFSNDVIKNKPATLRKFLVAYEQGVKALNADPAKYKGLLVDKGRVPDPVKDSFSMPPFPTASVPAKAEVSDVMSWMLEKRLLMLALPYPKMVDASFLPQ
jgi:NitT/TauT family transport system substrate-binding protein